MPVVRHDEVEVRSLLGLTMTSSSSLQTDFTWEIIADWVNFKQKCVEIIIESSTSLVFVSLCGVASDPDAKSRRLSRV